MCLLLLLYLDGMELVRGGVGMEEEEGHTGKWRVGEVGQKRRGGRI
jgi:hypothetical protein